MFEDKLLLFRLKCGSPEAFGRIYEKYRDFLLRIALGLLRDRQAAEDVVHDVFLRFVTSPDKISLHGKLKAFLRLCVVNAARDELRKRKLRPGVSCDETETVIAATPTPQKWLSVNEQSAGIINALGKLPPEQSETVVLHIFGEMTFRQIARQCEQTISTVQSRYRYGLDKLRSILSREELK